MKNPIKITFITIILGFIGLTVYGLNLDDDCLSSNVEKIYIRNELITFDSCNDEEETCYDTSSEDILDLLDGANNDEIKVIWLEVDSIGGEPQAAEEIYEKIKRIEKPVISFIRADGVSAAYWAAASSDYIFALNTSNVGSIGVTMSYTDNVKKNEKDGVSYNEINTGKFKDISDENKLLSAEDRGVLNEYLQSLYDEFVEDVSEGRGIDLNEVRKLADGRFWTGKQALELKLVDQLGTEDDVIKYIEELISEKADVCE